MVRAATIAAVTVSFLLFAGATASVGRAAEDWTTFYPVHQPVALDLPASWTNEPPPSWARFYSRSPDGLASAELDVATFSGSAGEFAAAAYWSARQTYLAQDPKASIRSRAVSLPGGRAFEVITRLVRRRGQHAYPLSVKVFSFLRAHTVYQFIYITRTAKVGAYFPVFDRSARSIRFH
jgi:hypothetical protein